MFRWELVDDDGKDKALKSVDKVEVRFHEMVSVKNVYGESFPPYRVPKKSFDLFPAI